MPIATRKTNKPQVSLEQIDVDGLPVQVTVGTPAQKSIYTLQSGELDEPITAIQLRALMEPETSRHTPSRAFVVSKFELRRVSADGGVSAVTPEEGADESAKAAQQQANSIELAEVISDDSNSARARGSGYKRSSPALIILAAPRRTDMGRFPRSITLSR